jgi:hypothetical protein
VKWIHGYHSLVSPCVDHANRFLLVLDELLKQPELFVSAVLCSESYFYTGNDNEPEKRPSCNEQEGYALFIKGN